MTDKSKKSYTKYLLVLLFLVILLVAVYVVYINFIKKDEQPQVDNQQPIQQEDDIEDEEVEEPILGDPYEEIFEKIEGQQAYIVVPKRIKEDNPPILIMYSHGSNTTVTENMEDQFMKDLKEYGIFFTQHNYIFAASNQHGVNWGNTASIQDTYNLKEWIESKYPIQEKVYLLGFSMGGLPTMNFTTTYPELVSKVALLAPTTKASSWDSKRVEKIKDIEIKIWHGNKDVNVPYVYTSNFVKKLSSLGKDIELITLEGKGHFDIDTEYMEDILVFFNQ